MGGAAFCTPLLTASGVIKVLFLDDRLEAYTKPIRTAELILEYPVQFVRDSRFLKVGHRIQGLLPDVQILLPSTNGASILCANPSRNGLS